MNEKEWLASDDPAKMLACLMTYNRPPWSQTLIDCKLRTWIETCREVFSKREGVHTLWHDLNKFPSELSACLVTWSDPEFRTRLLSMSERASILRDIVGNPFCLVEWQWDRQKLHSSGHHWTAICLAQAAYDHRDDVGYLDPFRLSLVADALEETGCLQDIDCNQCSGAGAYRSSLGPCVRCGYEGRLPNPILDHLRSPGPHGRGCWALDLARGENVT